MWGVLAPASIPAGTKQPLPTNSHCSAVLCEKHCEEQSPASGVCGGLCFTAGVCAQEGGQYKCRDPGRGLSQSVTQKIE